MAAFDNPVTAAPTTWIRRNLLLLSGVRPGARYNLPFFAHNALGNIAFTDEDCKVLRYCEDSVYTAVDHRLLWLDFSRLDREAGGKEEECEVMLHMFSAEDRRENAVSSGFVSQAEDVLFVSEFFREDLSAAGALAGWTVDDEAPRHTLHIITKVPSAAPPRSVPGRALCVNPLGGRVLLSHCLPLPAVTGRMQLRAHLYDSGSEDAHHWLGFSARSAAFAVGVHPCVKSHYACFCTADSDGDWGANRGWQQLKASRKVGLHVLELVLQDKLLSIVVDGHVGGILPMPALPGGNEEIYLGAVGNVCAFWRGVELLHTPFGDQCWEAGVHDVNVDRPFTWKPWKVRNSDNSRWEMDGTGSMRLLLDDIGGSGDNLQEVLDQAPRDGEPQPQAEGGISGLATATAAIVEHKGQHPARRQEHRVGPAALNQRAEERSKRNSNGPHIAKPVAKGPVKSRGYL